LNIKEPTKNLFNRRAGAEEIYRMVRYKQIGPLLGLKRDMVDLTLPTDRLV